MSDTHIQILAIFRDEATERLDHIEDVLLAVEAGQAAADAVDSLFRDAHSIKGNAGMVGLEEPGALAHAVEDLLELVRERGELPAALVDPLLRATDALRGSVDGDHRAVEAMITELRAVASGLASGSEPTADTGAEASQTAKPGAPGARDPQRTMRVAADKVDRLLDDVGEIVIHHRRLEHVGGAGAADRNQPLGEELSRGDRLLDELQDAVIQLRTLPLASITGPFPRTLRDLASAEGKEVELEISGADTQLDRVILDGMSEAISHLLRNAVAHGIEPPEEREAAGKPRQGRVELRAQPRGGLVAIEVADDGRGVGTEVLAEAQQHGSLADVLAEAGFSTALEVSGVAGRGVGLDAVKSQVEAIGGSLEVNSVPGEGTVVTLLLPVTLALLRVLLAERGGRVYGVPLPNVSEVMAIERSLTLGGRPKVELRNRAVPLGDLAAMIGAAAPELRAGPPAMVVSSGSAQVALACDRILGEDEVVVKGLGPLLAGVAGYLGSAILGDGRIALILDPAHVVKRTPNRFAGGAEQIDNGSAAGSKVLVVDDQFTVRELQRSILGAAGYRVETARHGREALEVLDRDQDIDLVVTDLQMPEMDGFELLEAIRRDAQRSALPVVIVTSRAGEDDKRRGAEAGADSYIVKEEFDQRALLETVERLVGR